MDWNEIVQNRLRWVVAVKDGQEIKAPIFDWARNGSSVRLRDAGEGIDVRVRPEDILRFTEPPT